MTESTEPSKKNLSEPQIIDDDALEQVSGGLKNITSPTNYTVNQTICFQSYIANSDGTVSGT